MNFSKTSHTTAFSQDSMSYGQGPSPMNIMKIYCSSHVTIVMHNTAAEFILPSDSTKSNDLT